MTEIPQNSSTASPGAAVEDLDVIVIGAGISGIGAAHRITERNPGLPAVVRRAGCDNSTSSKRDCCARQRKARSNASNSSGVSSTLRCDAFAMTSSLAPGTRSAIAWPIAGGAPTSRAPEITSVGHLICASLSCQATPATALQLAA